MSLLLFSQAICPDPLRYKKWFLIEKCPTYFKNIQSSLNFNNFFQVYAWILNKNIILMQFNLQIDML